MVKVITINILFDLTEWQQRRDLLVHGLAAEQADLIALQEVTAVLAPLAPQLWREQDSKSPRIGGFRGPKEFTSVVHSFENSCKLPEDTSAWLAEQLNMPYVYLVPKTSDAEQQAHNGIAILSRHPFVKREMLALQGQQRVAQYVQVKIDGQPLVFCNGHYYWYPGSHPQRDIQVQQVLDWLGKLPPDLPIVAVGDFNGIPEAPAIALMRQHFRSAYATYHGQEPAYTCPTPLVRRNWQKVIWHALRNLYFNRTLRPWRGTLDYIFVNHAVQVENCQLILNQPAPNSRTLYPSDHFGIMADLKI